MRFVSFSADKNQWDKSNYFSGISLFSPLSIKETNGKNKSTPTILNNIWALAITFPISLVVDIFSTKATKGENNKKPIRIVVKLKNR